MPLPKRLARLVNALQVLQKEYHDSFDVVIKRRGVTIRRFNH
jgi:hypothetical protein